ncbi:MAG: hypothetical protein ACFFAU_20210 [Candidatus Hodarchaeota archaeon]
MNYNYNMLIFQLITLSLAIFYPIQASGNEVNFLSQWEIVAWNEDNPVAWEYPSTYFTAKIGSIINYTLSSYDSGNFTNPSSGTIEIGNLTTQTNNNKTGEVLVLSIWGWFPGLITSANDWAYQKQSAQEAAEGEWTLGTLKIQDLIYNYKGMSRQAINFTYQQDPSIGNQNTSLIYDKNTGVLLEGHTELMFNIPYFLNIKLIFSDLIVPSDVNLTPQTIHINLIVMVFLGLFWGLLRKIN